MEKTNPPSPAPGPTPNPVEVRWVSLFIIASTVAIVWIFAHQFQRSEAFRVNASVNWQHETAIPLEPGPPWFWYEQNAGRLHALQVIEKDDKADLLKLYPRDSSGYALFSSAIDELAFRTQSTPRPSYLLTLLLGGLAAMIGVQIRTIQRFLYHACYKGTLDARIWWPWYLLRPVIGFLLGGAVILLAQVNLFSLSQSPTSELFWIGLSILVGFGTPDVVDRLHKVSETIFGKNQTSKPPVEPKPEPEVPPPPPPVDENQANGDQSGKQGATGTERKNPLLDLLGLGK